MGKTFQIKGFDISDGHHTFGELYDHRCLLFIRLCLALRTCARWKDESGTDWFILYLQLPEGQISYHIHPKYLTMVETRIQFDPYHKWDGHDSDTVISRLQGTYNDCRIDIKVKKPKRAVPRLSGDSKKKTPRTRKRMASGHKQRSKGTRSVSAPDGAARAGSAGSNKRNSKSGYCPRL